MLDDRAVIPGDRTREGASQSPRSWLHGWPPPTLVKQRSLALGSFGDTRVCGRHKDAKHVCRPRGLLRPLCRIPRPLFGHLSHCSDRHWKGAFPWSLRVVPSGVGSEAAPAGCLSLHPTPRAQHSQRLPLGQAGCCLCGRHAEVCVGSSACLLGRLVRGSHGQAEAREGLR